MKKVLSIVLALAMIVNLLLLGAVPAAADSVTKEAPSFSDWKTLDAGSATTQLTQVGTSVKLYTPEACSDRAGAIVNSPFKLQSEGFAVSLKLDQEGVTTQDGSSWAGFYIGNKAPGVSNGWWGTPASCGNGITILLNAVNSTTFHIVVYYKNMDSEGIASQTETTTLALVEGRLVNSINDPVTLALTPRVGGYDLVFNGEVINDANQFGVINNLLGGLVDSYVTAAMYSPASSPMQMTVSDLNGTTAVKPAADEPFTINDWSKLFYNGTSHAAVTTMTKVGSALQVSSTNANAERMGVQLLKPFAMSDGISASLSIDSYDPSDSWMMLGISNFLPSDGRYFDWSNIENAGSGIVFLIRVNNSTSISLTPYFMNCGSNGASDNIFAPAYFDGAATKNASLASLNDIQFSMKSNSTGGYEVLVNGVKIFNDGMNNDVAKVLGQNTDCYARFGGYSSNADFQFTIAQIDGKEAIAVTKVKDVNLSHLNNTVYLGDKLQLNASVVPSNAEDTLINFSSSDNNVAVVSSTGLVTSVSPGTAVITATSNEGNKTKECVITVPDPKNEAYYSYDWGKFDFWDGSANRPINTAMTKVGSGYKFNGTATNDDGGIGMAAKNGFKLSDGFSTVLGFDNFSGSGSGADQFFSIELLDRELMVNNANPDGRYASALCNKTAQNGAGLVFLLRPMGSNVILVQAALSGLSTSYAYQDGALNFLYTDTYIMVNDITNFKFQMVPRGDGGFDVVIDDGTVLMAGEDGTANPDNKFYGLSGFFGDNLTYFRMCAKNNQQYDMTFTVKKLNGMLAAGDETVGMAKPTGVHELLKDTDFGEGFNILKMAHDIPGPYNIGVMDYGKSGLPPVPSWNYIQWACRYNMADNQATSFTDLGSSTYRYSNLAQKFTVNTQTGQFALGLDSSAVFDHVRQNGEEWPHTLIETPRMVMNSLDKQYAKLSNIDNLRVQANLKLTDYEDLMVNEPQFDEELHSAQMVMFFQIKNVTASNPDDGLFWLGVIPFSSRYESSPFGLYEDFGKPDSSNKPIYAIAAADALSGSFYKNNAPYAGSDADWINMDFDALPYVKDAISRMHAQGGYLDYDLEDYYVGEMNIGWEMTGTYRGEMQVKDLSVKAYSNTIYDGLSRKYSVSAEDGTISKIKDNTTISEFMSNLIAPSNIVVFDGTTQITGSQKIGTGMTVKCMDGSRTVYQITAIVEGDVSGDGIINAEDIVCIKGHILNVSNRTLSGVYLRAGNLKDALVPSVSIEDLVLIKKRILSV